MSLGLCGSHRTGKSTLAKAISLRTGKPFIKTLTSDVFRQHGLDPALPMDFKTRLSIQQQVLIAAEEIWHAEKESFITDRTPIDMMAYTLADIQGSTQVDFSELERYVEHCFEVTNRFFDALIVLQPAIPLAHADGKAALNRAYMEHLNSLILGLCSDERLACGVLCVRREVTDLGERVSKVLGAAFNSQMLSQI